MIKEKAMCMYVHTYFQEVLFITMYSFTENNMCF